MVGVGAGVSGGVRDHRGWAVAGSRIPLIPAAVQTSRRHHGRLAVTVLPYNRTNPPLDPPAQCRNRLMWQVSRRLFGDHQPGPDGWCQVCRPYQYYPCVGRQLADIGMEAAHLVPDGSPWRLINVSPRNQRR
ncbi:hypothetical protein GCM10010199_45040 [Dactylosporangium roseum]